MKSLIPMKKRFVLDRCNLTIKAASEYAQKHDLEVELAYNKSVNFWRKYTLRKPLTLAESTAKLKAHADSQWWGWDSARNYPCDPHREMAMEMKSAALCTEGDTVYISPSDWTDL